MEEKPVPQFAGFKKKGGIKVISIKVLGEIRRNPGIDTRLLIAQLAIKFNVTKQTIAGSLSFLKQTNRIHIRIVTPKRYSVVR